MVRSGEDSDATIVVTSGIDQKARLVLVDPAPDGLGSTFEIYNGMCIAPSCIPHAWVMPSLCVLCMIPHALLVHSMRVSSCIPHASNA